MKEISQDQLKEIQIEILNKFNSFCRENSIKYSLAAGSLIGAIRHQGYIPWDDDIDVMMTRGEYKKLCERYHDDRYRLLTPYTDKQYPYPFAKIIDSHTIVKEEMKESYSGMGVYIDIFIFDERPEKEKFKFIRFLKHIQTIKTLPNRNERKLIRKIIVNCCQFVLKPISINTISRLIDKKAQRWFNTNADYSLIVWSNDLHILFSRREMDEVIDWQFENLICLITTQYDSVLNKRYGEYMRLPPETEQIPKHTLKAYKID